MVVLLPEKHYNKNATGLHLIIRIALVFLMIMIVRSELWQK